MFQHPSARLALAVGTGVPARACARIVARNGMPRLADVDRVTGEPRGRGPVTEHRSEREGPGELIHVDVKKVARIPAGVGWRAHARGCAALLSRARDLYRGLGAKVERVMTDNGPGYRPPRLFNGWLESAGSRHVYTRPHGPWQNGKVERMNQTLARE